VEELMESIDSLLSMSAFTGSKSTGDALCIACGLTFPKVREMVDNVTLISIHAFMDEHTFDLRRAQKCCVTEILPDGRMIPLCVYNILYRRSMTQGFQDLCHGSV
jgi:uncharacterized radical SAM superfamily Fe-S cluster-containing enzyme